MVRRKDREMSSDFGIEMIDRAQYGVLSMVDEKGEPYSIPLSIVRKDDTLYFHSAKEGRKVELFEREPKVSVVFVGNVKVPELYTNEELEMISEDKGAAAALASTVFTTEFESAVVSGTVRKVEDRVEKIEALRLICEKYTPSKLKFIHIAIEGGLERTNIYSIKIEEITAKRKKFDDKGEEMKWGRME